MERKNIILIVVVVIICIAICCLSPFIASSNPDGLEKTVEDVSSVGNGQYNIQEKTVIESPFADYTFEPLGKIGEIIALIIGVIIVLIIGIGIGKLLENKKK
ncbi:MAG: PDGLE domain-containing protein [Methanobrevibacter sp.]|nr:PDGLE domain-containing protein [Methanobrevibacter sp.]